MGQEQSLSSAAAAAAERAPENFRVVNAAADPSLTDLSNEPLMRAVNALPMPLPVLPPSPVRDDAPSALAGANMLHGLRAALGTMHMGALLPGGGPSASAPVPASEPADTADTAVEAAVPAPVPNASQEGWARAAIDVGAVAHATAAAAGGGALEAVLARQDGLADAVARAAEAAERVRFCMEAMEKESARTRAALQRLERLRMAAADVQDGLEAGVATANILGASHFASDPELRSFKDYLRCHPIQYEDL